MQTLASPTPATAPAVAPLDKIELLPGDSRAVAALAHEYVRATGSLSAERALRLATLMAHELPRPLRRALVDFRLTGLPRTGLLITGLPVDEHALGPTPTGCRQRPDGPEQHRAEAVLLLLGSLLGEPFSSHGRQDGRLVLDQFPAAGPEDRQQDSGPRTALDAPTEGAPHPPSTDWTMLLGLRNQDRVMTTFVALGDLRLSASIRRVLFQKRFHVLPDRSPSQATRLRPVALLEGDTASPWLRADPSCIRAVDGDSEAAAALQTLLTAVRDHLTDIPLGSGELLVLDNKRAVHGHRPFTARRDGTDRWLKRLDLTADLRAGTGRYGRAVD